MSENDNGANNAIQNSAPTHSKIIWAATNNCFHLHLKTVKMVITTS